MSNDPPPARVLLRPDPDFKQLPIPVTRQPQRIWFRVHKAGTPAILFAKFPRHRFSHPNCPFPFLYVGATLQTCLWEYFGDDVFHGKRMIAAGKWRGCCVSQILVPELNACAVSLEKTRDAMRVDKATLLAADLAVPQSWSLAIQEHPADFDAIKYSSRFLDQTCLALFERGRMQSRMRETLLGPLSSLDPAVDWLDERKAALI
jgi:hypothetical protein